MVDIEKLRGLLARADKRWHLDEDGDLAARVPTCWREDAWQDEQGRSNAALVVATVNALPALLDELERKTKALEAISRNETEVWDEDLGCLVTVSCDAEELAAIAYNALTEIEGTPNDH